MKTIILLSFAFGLSELLLLVVKRSNKKNLKIRSDKGSLILLWIMITLGFTFGFILAAPPINFWLGFGCSFMIIGLIARWAAILQLGSSFTVDVAITDVSGLKTDGIYNRMRHPSYFGLLMIVMGFSCAMSSVYSFMVLVIPVFFAIIYRIKVEEELLIKEFGNSYLEYIKRTRKIFPGIY